MALVPKISGSFDCCEQQLVLTDKTGEYNASTNTGGWETPNRGVAEVTASTITITDPNGNESTHTATSLPLSTLTLEPSDLDSSYTSFPDGQYTIVWSITAVETYTAYTNPFNVCTLCSCVTNKVAEHNPDCDCGCDDCAASVMKYVVMLGALKGAISCGKSAKADELFAELQSMCNNTCNDC